MSSNRPNNLKEKIQALQQSGMNASAANDMQITAQQFADLTIAALKKAHLSLSKFDHFHDLHNEIKNGIAPFVRTEANAQNLAQALAPLLQSSDVKKAASLTMDSMKKLPNLLKKGGLAKVIEQTAAVRTNALAEQSRINQEKLQQQKQAEQKIKDEANNYAGKIMAVVEKNLVKIAKPQELHDQLAHLIAARSKMDRSNSLSGSEDKNEGVDSFIQKMANIIISLHKEIDSSYTQAASYNQKENIIKAESIMGDKLSKAVTLNNLEYLNNKHYINLQQIAAVLAQSKIAEIRIEQNKASQRRVQEILQKFDPEKKASNKSSTAIADSVTPPPVTPEPPKAPPAHNNYFSSSPSPSSPITPKSSDSGSSLAASSTSTPTPLFQHVDLPSSTEDDLSVEDFDGENEAEDFSITSYHIAQPKLNDDSESSLANTMGLPLSIDTDHDIDSQASPVETPLTSPRSVAAQRPTDTITLTVEDGSLDENAVSEENKKIAESAGAPDTPKSPLKITEMPFTTDEEHDIDAEASPISSPISSPQKNTAEKSITMEDEIHQVLQEEEINETTSNHEQVEEKITDDTSDSNEPIPPIVELLPTHPSETEGVATKEGTEEKTVDPANNATNPPSPDSSTPIDETSPSSPIAHEEAGEAKDYDSPAATTDSEDQPEGLDNSTPSSPSPTPPSPTPNPSHETSLFLAPKDKEGGHQILNATLAVEKSEAVTQLKIKVPPTPHALTQHDRLFMALSAVMNSPHNTFTVNGRCHIDTINAMKECCSALGKTFEEGPKLTIIGKASNSDPRPFMEKVHDLKDVAIKEKVGFYNDQLTVLAKNPNVDKDSKLVGIFKEGISKSPRDSVISPVALSPASPAQQAQKPLSLK